MSPEIDGWQRWMGFFRVSVSSGRCVCGRVCVWESVSGEDIIYVCVLVCVGLCAGRRGGGRFRHGDRHGAQYSYCNRPGSPHSLVL
jgi:hypothetical protein